MKTHNVIHFFKQMIVLLDLGLHINQCIQICIQVNSKSELEHELKRLYQDLELGEHFIDAFKKQGLDHWTLNLLHFSLETQQLKTGLSLYVEQHQNRLKLKKIISQQLFYPGLMLILSLIILVFFSQNILPAYQSLYHQFQIEIPQSLLLIDNGLNLYYLCLSLGLCLILTLHPKLILFIPILGRMKKNYHWSIWFNLMYMGLASGMTFHQSLVLIAPEIKKTHLHLWHQDLIHELQLGRIEMQQISPPKCLPKILHAYFNILAYDKNTPKLCKKAYVLLKQIMQDDILKIKKYLQPTMLFLVSLFCTYLLYLFYQPLLHLQEIF